MSLLLDALKKAAEQKAAKAREKEAEQPDLADETALETVADQTGPEDDGSIPRHMLEDETELDYSELQTRLERARVGREDGTETGLEMPDDTGFTSSARSEQIHTGEDETIIFNEDDIAEFMDDSPQTDESARAFEDETDLSQLARRDQTGLGAADYAEAGDARQPAEDTDIRLPEQAGDTGAGAAAIAAEDETDLSMPVPRADEVAPGMLEARGETAEDTDLGRTRAGAPEDTGLGLTPETAREDTGLDQPESPPVDDEITADDDMSLMLVEREQTSFTSPTSATDPQRPQDQFGALRGEEPAGADLSLSDTTQRRAGLAAASGGSDTATTGIADSTRTAPGAAPRADATGTYTYAPDNYDRTLMRLPNDDASRLFAGMKSDSDVVMTPEYAKQVFRSKSSAQRVQHYKVYGGVVIAILATILTFGLFEYQSEVETIDTSLRPLKRDPMPGVIKPRGEEQQPETLFVEDPVVDERTIQLIQNADEEPVPDDGVIAGVSEEPVADEPVAKEPVAEEAGKPEVEVASAAPTRAASSDEAVPVSGELGISAIPAGASGAGASASSTLQIRSSERIQRKQTLLREAYEAYKAGNDELALARYNEVLSQDPANRGALLGRAAINVQNDNSGAAIADYRSLLLANPKDSLAMASLLAVTSFSPRETETQLKLMIRDEPDSPYLNFALANAYGAQNRWQEAQGHYFKALQHNPDDPNYAYNLAVSLEHISQPRAAISYYRRALENYNKGLATFNRDVVDRRLEILEQQ